MKRSVLIILGYIFYCSQGWAQSRHNVYFFKNSGKEVKTRDSADYIRIVSEPDSGSTLYNVSEIYSNNKPKLLGKISMIGDLRLEGQVVTYYPSGKRQQVATYQKGIKLGDVYEYYPNGKLYTHEQYLRDDNNRGPGLATKLLILDCIDSTGKILTINGDGYYIRYAADFKNIVEEGTLKAGLKDGEWKGDFEYKKNAKLTFLEQYKSGKLVSGQSTDENNQSVSYTVAERMPTYTGGMDAFYVYLAKNIQYPYTARSSGIQGAVYIAFVVEKDGTLTDFRVVKSPDDKLSEEALRVLKKSPKWIPGLQYGRPVRVVFTVPVNFTLHANPR